MTVSVLTFDCRVNSVSPRKTPSVIKLICRASVRSGTVKLPEHSQCLENQSRVEEGDGDTESEGLKEREDREENEVGGMAVALP